MKRKLTLLWGSIMCFLFSVMPVNAGFDTGTAQSTINSYLDPLRQFLLWFVPVAFVVSALVSGSKWFFMDEQEEGTEAYHKDTYKACDCGSCHLVRSGHRHNSRSYVIKERRDEVPWILERYLMRRCGVSCGSLDDLHCRLLDFAYQTLLSIFKLNVGDFPFIWDWFKGISILLFFFVLIRLCLMYFKTFYD